MKMHVSHLALFFLLLAGFSQTTFAQTSNPNVLPLKTPSPMEVQKRADEINNQRGMKDDSGMIANRPDMRIPAVKELYRGKNKENRTLRKQFERTRNLLKPTAQQYATYKNLLGRNKMQLLRLQEEKNCNFEGVIFAENLERCAEVIPIYGNGSYYSFRMNTHYFLEPIITNVENDPPALGRADTHTVMVNLTPMLGFTGMGKWWNIHFSDGVLEANEAFLQDFTEEIGSADLNSFTSDSPQLKFLGKYEKKTEYSTAANGTVLKTTRNLRYPKSAPVKIGNTYLFHSFTRELDVRNRTIPAQTVLFKIVGQEADKSLIILVYKVKNEQAR